MLNSSKGSSESTTDVKKNRKLHIAIVQAEFNSDITGAMRKQCIETLQALGVTEKHIKCFEVPGALEVPVTLKTLAERYEYDALIAIGCVIRGDTYHFELVANESARGITNIAIDYDLPIINTILTVENTEQAQQRIQVKAIDAAHAAVQMAHLINRLA